MRFRRTRRALGLVPVLAVLVFSAAIPVSPSAAAVPAVSLPQTGAGIDISFPQCTRATHVELPPHTPFAVIGVNGGSAFNSNPCFASEYNSAFLLAGATNQPHVSVYVNTGNPALAGVWWPTSDVTRAGTTLVNPNGSCRNLPGAACAYVYGYSMAEADYRRVRKTLVRMPGLWWLDVETSNTWQTDVTANAASISGMVDYFRSKYLDVGLYSTGYQWNRIAGVTSATSDLAGLPSWLAGGSYLGAPADCEKSALTPNGRVAMIQYVKRFDNDYSCRLFNVSTAIISNTGPPVVGTELEAQSGQWGPGFVTYAYQWNRNGIAIAGAAAKSYLLTETDAGAEITVTITGYESGYSAASQTSSPIGVLAPSVD